MNVLEPLAVLAVDAEIPALDELAFLLRADARVGLVDVASDAKTALLMLCDRRYDLLMLDVRIQQFDGLDLARVLLRFAEPPSVVFVTAYEEDMSATFEARASDYLVKPPSVDRLGEALDRVCLMRSQTVPAPADDFVVVPVPIGGTTRTIERSDVMWVEAQGDYVRLHVLGDANHLVRLPISVLAERWTNSGFVQIHRGYLVAIRHIAEIRSEAGATTVRIGRTELPVSRRHSRELRARMVGTAWRSGPG